MTKEELYGLLRFYKGEEENPFAGIDEMKTVWWEGEKTLFTQAVLENRWQYIVDNLKEAITNHKVSGILVDDSIPIENRAIYFYLDIWYGKLFPYDNLDNIFNYLKK